MQPVEDHAPAFIPGATGFLSFANAFPAIPQAAPREYDPAQADFHGQLAPTICRPPPLIFYSDLSGINSLSRYRMQGLDATCHGTLHLLNYKREMKLALQTEFQVRLTFLKRPYRCLTNDLACFATTLLDNHRHSFESARLVNFE